MGLRCHVRDGGVLSGSPPKATAREMIVDSCIASANTVIGAPLALPARTRYNTSGLERPLLWPVLPCPPMAGFEVSTEGVSADALLHRRCAAQSVFRMSGVVLFVGLDILGVGLCFWPRRQVLGGDVLAGPGGIKERRDRVYETVLT
jgi:hypothetical protein